MAPKVSVIVPVYNNEAYVPTCVKSLLAQTLEDIEIICINDGSTDSSSKILHEFAENDSRVIVVDKENAGYGAGINSGLDRATGKYVTILESDDFADLDMLETLYKYAEEFDLEVVRANFYLYWSSKIKNDHLLELFGWHECDRIIDPSNRDDQHCFYAQPALWSALYRTDFIKGNNLRLLETPGAAYQDTAFNFKIWACAHRVMFIHEPFVHYRQDNEASSINNPGKVNTICLEYDEIRRWLHEDRPDLLKSLGPVATKMMCDAYLWNIGRISERFRLDFAKVICREFSAAESEGLVDPKLYAPGQLYLIKLSQTDLKAFVDYAVRGIDPAKGIDRYWRKFHTFLQVKRLYGFSSAKGLLIDRLTHPDGHEEPLVDAIDNEMATRGFPSFVSSCGQPKISVVMPVYNCESVLEETLDSVLAQTFKEFELICIDDGSTDRSSEILKHYAANDARIRVISQQNAGVAAARNRGLAEVRAPYTLILDSDDIFVPTMFDALYTQASVTNADMVVCRSLEYDGETYKSTPMEYALKLNLLPKDDCFTVDQVSDVLFEAFMGWPWDRLYRTDFILKTGLLFPEDMKNSEDAVFVYGLLSKADSIAIVRDFLVKHRSTRKGSVSNSRDKAPECFYDAICRIKAELKQDPARYKLLERSFLNWALDYTLWNISTLTDKHAKRDLAQRLVCGRLTELETGKHSWRYFGLYGASMRRRFLKMRLVALGLID